MKHQLKDLLDLPELQALLDRLDDSFGCPTAIVDNQGTVLTASGWQELCTDFHRVHPLGGRACRQSDLHIFERLERGDESVVYPCPRGMIDCATPIVIDGEHLGNVFIGQVLMEPPDVDAFREQARAYGFDEERTTSRRSNRSRWSARTILGAGCRSFAPSPSWPARWVCNVCATSNASVSSKTRGSRTGQLAARTRRRRHDAVG